VSLISRHLEQAGIPTVIMGSAIDIIEHCRVPRYLHADLPLGNPCGVPFDRPMQMQFARRALDLIANATAPETVTRNPETWPGDNSWRDDYARVDDSNRAELMARGEARRKQQADAKNAGIKRAQMISD